MKTILAFIKSNGLQSIFLIVGLGLFFLLINQVAQCTDTRTSAKLENQVRKNEIQAAVDDSRIKPLKMEILRRDSAIKALELEIKQAKKETNSHIVLVKKYKSKAAKLEADYNREKTIPKADKVIEEKNKTIHEQDSVIESIGQEAEIYSNEVVVLKGKIVLHVEEIKIKDNALKIKDNQINELIAQNKKTLKRKKLGDTVRNIIIVAETVFLIIKM